MSESVPVRAHEPTEWVPGDPVHSDNAQQRRCSRCGAEWVDGPASCPQCEVGGTFGARLKTRRVAAGLTQTEFAEAVDLTRSSSPVSEVSRVQEPEPISDEELRQFLLDQFKRDELTARAMPHAIEGLQSRWSPAQLIVDCLAKTEIVMGMPACPQCRQGQRCILHDSSAGTPTWRWLHPEDRTVAELLARKYAHLLGGDHRG